MIAERLNRQQALDRMPVLSANPQPQTTTDAAGVFQLAGLVAGQVTLRFDATPANPDK